MQKTRFGDNNHPSTDYRAERKVNTQPKIVESYLTDENDVMHILASGNEISQDMYQKMWEPVKTKILPKNFKGRGIDSRTNWR